MENEYNLKQIIFYEAVGVVFGGLIGILVGVNIGAPKTIKLEDLDKDGKTEAIVKTFGDGKYVLMQDSKGNYVQINELKKKEIEEYKKEIEKIKKKYKDMKF